MSHSISRRCNSAVIVWRPETKNSPRPRPVRVNKRFGEVLDLYHRLVLSRVLLFLSHRLLTCLPLSVASHGDPSGRGRAAGPGNDGPARGRSSPPGHPRRGHIAGHQLHEVCIHEGVLLQNSGRSR